MSKKISTYYADDNRGYCELHVDYKEEMFYLKYFDDHGKQFFTEEYPNKSMRYVEDAAENWAAGIKKLDMLYG
jgi:hypothetical protein